MLRRLAAVTLVVPDYDAAIAFFTGTLGMRLVEDVPQDGKRWVRVAADRGADLILAEPKNAAERAAIGNQTGGRVGFFLETADFARDHAAFSAAGVRFIEPPRRERYGTVAKFADPWGNLWDLIEPAR